MPKIRLQTNRSAAVTVLAAMAVLLAVSFSAAGAGVPSDDEIVAAVKSKASPEEKLEYLLQLERGTERDATIFFQTANTYFSLSQFDSALTYYNSAVIADPGHFKAYVNMGIVYDETGQASAGAAAYRKALDIKPDDVLAHCHLGYNLVHSGEVDEGVKHYLRALEIAPDSPQAHYNLGLAFADLKVFGEAIKEWQTVVKLDPDSDLGKTASENVKLIQSYLSVEP